jgi:hypothetical protein
MICKDSIIHFFDLNAAVSFAKYYVNIMSKILKTGKTDYPQTELKRISKLIESGSMSIEQLDKMRFRKNILSIFANAAGVIKDEL